MEPLRLNVTGLELGVAYGGSMEVLSHPGPSKQFSRDSWSFLCFLEMFHLFIHGGFFEAVTDRESLQASELGMK